MRAAIGLWLAAPALHALAQPVACPPTLPKEAVIVQAPAGWQGYSASIVRLTGFGMMAGPPESMTYLVPADEKKQQGRSVTSWRFESGGARWLYCTYDGSAAIQISRPLEAAATRCEVSAETIRGMIKSAEARCQ